MTKLRKLFSAALVAAAVAGASANAQAQTAAPGVTDGEILIGVFAPLSGALISYGLDPANAAKMWYEEINRKGGIHGRKIRVVTEDDKCSPTELVAVVKKLVTVDKVFLLHGGSCTAAVVAAQEYITREKIPLVMLAAAGDGAVFPPTRYVFGAFGGSQRAGGASIVEFAAKELKGKRIAFIGHDDDYGNSAWATASAVAKRLGVQIVAEQRIPPGLNDMSAPALRLRAAKPDVVVSAVYPAPAVLLAQKLAEYGMTATPLVQAVQGVPSPATFAKNVGNEAALANFYYAWPYEDLTSASGQKWVQMYRSHYPDRTPGPFMVAGLPPAMAITDALQRAGRNLTREAFVNAMESVKIDTGVTVAETSFTPDRRDGLRGYKIIKFDGTNYKMMPGVYLWNGTDGR